MHNTRLVRLILTAGLMLGAAPLLAQVRVAADALRNLDSNPVLQAVGEYVGLVCANGVLNTSESRGLDLQRRCNNMAAAVLGGFTGELDRVRTALINVADDEHVSTRTSLESATFGGVTGRIGGASGFGLAAGADGPGSFSWSSAAGDSGSPWNVSLNGVYSTSDQSESLLEPGFTSDDFGLTIGADYQWSEAVLLGAAVSYRNTTAKIRSGGGSLESDNYGFYSYASFMPAENWYIDGILSYAAADHEQVRTVNYVEPNPLLGTATTINQSMLSNTNSDELAAGLTVGYNYAGESWVLSPFARIDYADSSIDGFTEEPGTPTAPGAGLALIVNDQDYESLVTVAGLSVSGNWDSDMFGMVYPQAFIEYAHEFENDNDAVIGKFAADPLSSGFSFAMPTEAPDRSYFNLGASLTAQITDSTQAYARYQGLLGYHDLSVHAFEIGIRQGF